MATAPFRGVDLLLSSLSHSACDLACLKLQLSPFVHDFGPPLSADLHGLWKWHTTCPDEEALPLGLELPVDFWELDRELSLELLLSLPGDRPGVPLFFSLSGHLLL